MCFLLYHNVRPRNMPPGIQKKPAVAKTNKRKSHLAAERGHGKKRPPTSLAKKGGPRPSKTNGNQKSGSSQGKSKEAKTKSPKLLLSQNR